MIVLFTDFGVTGPYVGQMQAVLNQIAPGVPVIQLFADAPRGQPKPCAYLLAAYAAWFPPGSIFLCVVDPEVGSDRRGLIVEADGRLYVGPDNGLFELTLRRAQSPRIAEITWQPPALSASFHGRDLFAPIAGRLARGEAPTSLARPVVPLTHADWPDDLAEIIYVDHFGNALTGLRGDRLPTSARLSVRGCSVAHARTFSAAPAGGAFWYVNSNGLVEIAVNGGRADQVLHLALGCEIQIS